MGVLHFYFNKENKRKHCNSFFNPPVKMFSYKLFAFSGFGLFKPNPDHQPHSRTGCVKTIAQGKCHGKTRGTWNTTPPPETHGNILHPRLSVYPISCLHAVSLPLSWVHMYLGRSCLFTGPAIDFLFHVIFCTYQLFFAFRCWSQPFSFLL